MWRLRKKFDLEEQSDKNRGGTEGKLNRNKTLVNTHMIVAALITTVAFTAGFALPGGFDEKKGYAVLRNTAFKTFLIADSLALLFSLSSLFLYFVTTVSDDNLKVETWLVIGVLLNYVSFVAMMLAFISGTYAVLPHMSNIAVSVCVISALFIILVVSGFIKLFKYAVNVIRYA